MLEKSLSGLLITGEGFFLFAGRYPQRTTASRPAGAPAGQKVPGAEAADAAQADAAARADGQRDRADRTGDQPKTPPGRQTSHQTRPAGEIRQATA